MVQKFMIFVINVVKKGRIKTNSLANSLRCGTLSGWRNDGPWAM